MDWQSGRGSRRNRIRKEPEGRNPLVLVLIVVVLMVGAIVLGYLISQAILPMFVTITPAQPSVSVSEPSLPSGSSLVSLPSTEASSEAVSEPSSQASSEVVDDPESEPSEEESEPSQDPSEEQTTPETPPVGNNYLAQLPVLSYYRVQVASGASNDAATAVMNELIAQSYTSAVVPKSGAFSVQVGMFGDRAAAQALAAEMDAAGYEGAWVTDWSISLSAPAALSADEEAVRKAQEPVVQQLADAVATVLHGGTPSVSGLSLPSSLSAEEEARWNRTVGYVRDWANIPDARTPSLLQEIVSDMQYIYSWFGA